MITANVVTTAKMLFKFFCFFLLSFVHKVMQQKNYITAVDRTSAEMKTAELLSGADGAYLFNFYAKEEYKTLTIYLSEYQAGELINKRKWQIWTMMGSNRLKEV